MRLGTGLLVSLALVTVVLVPGCATPTQPQDTGDDHGVDDPPRDGNQSPAPEEGSQAPFPPAAKLEAFVSGLQNPLFLTSANDGTGRLFAVEQPGRIRVIQDGALADEPYLDLTDRVESGGEKGLLGIAFDPSFATNGRLFVSYTTTQGASGLTSVLERFTVDEPATGHPDASQGTVLLTQQQPYGNHNGGHLAFGPDGYLYYGLGDGGSGGDPQGNAQDTSTWLGGLLRLEIDGEDATPAPGNPFLGEEGRDEIWAYGLRNPWRFSFDRATGALYIGDVGQNSWEEINRQPAASSGGENYGWDRWEGTHVHEGTPSRQGYTFPILEYARAGGHCSVTGGYVYQGDAVPDLDDRYVYGDYCSGNIWAAQPTEDGWESARLLDTQLRITSFGEDAAGELYVIGQGGSIYQLVEA